MTFRPLLAELIHADRHDESNSRFSQFCEKRLKTTRLSSTPEKLVWNGV